MLFGVAPLKHSLYKRSLGGLASYHNYLILRGRTTNEDVRTHSRALLKWEAIFTPSLAERDIQQEEESLFPGLCKKYSVNLIPSMVSKLSTTSSRAEIFATIRCSSIRCFNPF